MRVLLLLPLLVLTACSAGGDDSLAAAPASSSLAVEVDRGDGSAPEEWTLDCASPGDSDHPDAEAACAGLAASDDPFLPLAADVLCTEQYGGPETAQVTGSWQGEPVDLLVQRRNGCEIAQWDGLVPLLPRPS